MTSASTTAAHRVASWFLLGLVRLSVAPAFVKRAAEAYYRSHVGWRPMRLRRATSFGAQMDLHLPDSIGTTIATTGLWEPSISCLVASRLAKGDTFIDVGANIGYYTLLANMLVGESGRVFSIEASPRIFEQLSRNLSLNDGRNVTIIHAAASDREGSCPIFIETSGNAGHSTIMEGVAGSGQHAFEATVRCGTLASLVGRSELLKARLIKIDIEGAERMAIEGVASDLANFSDRTEWIMELSPGMAIAGALDVEWIFAQFVRAGYSAYAIRKDNSLSLNSKILPTSVLDPIAAPPKSSAQDVFFSRCLTNVAFH